MAWRAAIFSALLDNIPIERVDRIFVCHGPKTISVLRSIPGIGGNKIFLFIFS